MVHLKKKMIVHYYKYWWKYMDSLYTYLIYEGFSYSHHTLNQWRSQIDNWGDIFIYSCSLTFKNNQIQKNLIKQNTNIWICPPLHLSSWLCHCITCIHFVINTFTNHQTSFTRIIATFDWKVYCTVYFLRVFYQVSSNLCFEARQEEI